MFGSAQVDDEVGITGTGFVFGSKITASDDIDLENEWFRGGIRRSRVDCSSCRAFTLLATAMTILAQMADAVWEDIFHVRSHSGGCFGSG